MRLFDKIGEIPTKLQVQVGALVANIKDGVLYSKDTNGNIIPFSGMTVEETSYWVCKKYGSGETVIYSKVGSIKAVYPKALNSWEYSLAGGFEVGWLKDTEYTVIVNEGTPIKHVPIILSGVFNTIDNIRIGSIQPFGSIQTGDFNVNIVIHGRWK